MMTTDNQITVEDARWWMQALEGNLLDADYRVSTDTETHFKIAAVRRLIERNEELETALSALNKYRDSVGKILGAVL